MICHCKFHPVHPIKLTKDIQEPRHNIDRGNKGRQDHRDNRVQEGRPLESLITVFRQTRNLQLVTSVIDVDKKAIGFKIVQTMMIPLPKTGSDSFELPVSPEVS